MKVSLTDFPVVIYVVIYVNIWYGDIKSWKWRRSWIWDQFKKKTFFTKCFHCRRLTGDFVRSDPDSMEVEEAEFNWEEFMEETGANAAPHTTFKHVSDCVWSPPVSDPLNTPWQINTTCRNPLTTHRGPRRHRHPSSALDWLRPLMTHKLCDEFFLFIFKRHGQ